MSKPASESRDISKLPKWARERIEYLEALASTYKDEIEKLNGRYPESRIRYGYGETGQGYLPDDEYIHFVLDKDVGNSTITVYIDTKGALLLMGDSAIAIKPRASNVAEITLEE